MKRIILTSIALVMAALTYYGCGGSSSTSGSFATGAISSPLTSGVSAQVIQGSRIFASTYSDRVTTLTTLLTTGDKESCNFVIDLTGGNGRAACYGPKMILGGTHPDTSASPSPAFLPEGDTGIWNSTNSGESCTSAQLNSLMDYHTKYAYFAQLAGAALKCFASNSSITLPTLTTDPVVTLDAAQLADFSFASGSDSFTASSATITGITDTAGDFGYKYVISGTVVASSITYPFTVKLYTVEESDGGYAGKASYTFRESAGMEPNCPSGGGNPTHTSRSGTMIFSRADSSSHVKLMLNQGTYCGTVYDPLILNDGVDVCDIASDPIANSTDANNGWAGNWNYLNFDFDPSTEVGTYAYSWQAGKGDSNSRVFNVSKSSASDAVGYFGFGPDVRNSTSSCTGRATDIGKIKGMICNWAGPGNAHSYQNFVQKQVITKSSGIWGVTSENILYNPVNTCLDRQSLTFYSFTDANNNNVFDGSDVDLNYSGDSDQNTTYTGTNNLETLSNYQAAFTAPTEPTF